MIGGHNDMGWYTEHAEGRGHSNGFGEMVALYGTNC